MENLLDQAQQISPYNNYVYAFLVIILLTGIITLSKLMKDIVKSYWTRSSAVIEKNTLAFERHNDLINQKIEQEKLLMTEIDKMMNKMDDTIHKQNSLMDTLYKFFTSNSKLP